MENYAKKSFDQRKFLHPVAQTLEIFASTHNLNVLERYEESPITLVADYDDYSSDVDKLRRHIQVSPTGNENAFVVVGVVQDYDAHKRRASTRPIIVSSKGLEKVLERMYVPVFKTTNSYGTIPIPHQPANED
jgi:hypothetical protein